MSKRFLLALVCAFMVVAVLAGCSTSSPTPGGDSTGTATTIPTTPTTTPTTAPVTPTATPTTAPVAPTATTATAIFSVKSIDLTVNPTSIAGKACNSTITLTYTTTFHVVPTGAGGLIQFSYTTNNGRSQMNESVTVSPNLTEKVYTFTVSGTLYPDNTFPGNAIVLVSSPNSIESAGVKPAGQCS